MLSPSQARALTRTLGPVTLPSFLVPAFQSPPQTRQFSATASSQSKLGRTPISIPPGVELTIGEPKVKKDSTTWMKIAKRTVSVAGPLGKLDLEIPPFMKIDYDGASRQVMLSVEDQEIKKQKEMWGTKWSYLNRYVRGVSEGHTTVLRLVGIGYRAAVEERPREEQYPGQQFVVLKLGFSHPVVMPVPEGIKASAPQVTRILLEGIDKEVMHEFAAKIRRWRVPEPYKGKGIFVNDETIKLKQKKIK
ncbi:ribosomal protein L6, alpha-beta domain-containing protein [Immersiella caudata]|uniref:Ribosomal protein L6, alpha-beta domain-containing protein n=1 Tax=Immersiella caudata TaxID=314043 RepID=A0AA39WL23_9PEZI|nr:ribosomal protein L6, alpha-beta domain-containing protein [Immersiella caudata]